MWQIVLQKSFCGMGLKFSEAWARRLNNDVGDPRQVALEGFALIQTPLLFIASDLSEGKLTTVLEQWAPTPVTGFFLYYPSRRQMRPALKALVDFLRDEHHGASKRLGLSPVLVTEIFRCPMSALGQQRTLGRV